MAFKTPNEIVKIHVWKISYFALGTVFQNTSEGPLIKNTLRYLEVALIVSVLW